MKHIKRLGLRKNHSIPLKVRVDGELISDLDIVSGVRIVRQCVTITALDDLI